MTQEENGHCDQVVAGTMLFKIPVLKIIKQLKLHSLKITQTIVLERDIKKTEQVAFCASIIIYFLI